MLEKQLIGETDSSDRDFVLPKEDQRKLRGIALGVLGRRYSDHAEEVVQQATLQCLQASRNRLSPYNDPMAVMRTAVRNAARTHLKKCRKEDAVDFNGLFSQQGEDDQAFNARDRLALTRPINPIEIENRRLELMEKLVHISDVDLFLSFYVEGWTPTEIAKKRKWNCSKVSRALKKLRRELGIGESSLNAVAKEKLSQKVNKIMKTQRPLQLANTGGVTS
jgi:RNA polymerase sigma factor (sigma-70 family)